MPAAKDLRKVIGCARDGKEFNSSAARALTRPGGQRSRGEDRCIIVPFL